MERATSSFWIDLAWPGLGKQLSLNIDGKHLLNLRAYKQVQDLTPLKGMLLTNLDLNNCSQVRDLTPLQGMKLSKLGLQNCSQVRDLTPLKGMPLQILSLPPSTSDKDLLLLKDMPLTYLSLAQCLQVRDLTLLDSMNLHTVFLQEPLGPVKGLDVLRRMQGLRFIRLTSDPEKNIPVAEFWKKYDAGEFTK